MHAFRLDMYESPYEILLQYRPFARFEPPKIHTRKDIRIFSLINLLNLTKLLFSLVLWAHYYVGYFPIQSKDQCQKDLTRKVLLSKPSFAPFEPLRQTGRIRKGGMEVTRVSAATQDF